MKNFGFTLAEVLITMTIIGVVAALTTPALYHNAYNAQVGPKLAKIKSTIENANQRMMQDEEVLRISALLPEQIGNGSNNDINMIKTYVGLISNYMRLEHPDDPAYANNIYPYNGGKTPITSIPLRRVNYIDPKNGMERINGGLTMQIANNPGVNTADGATLWFCFKNYIDFRVNPESAPMFRANNESMVLVDINGTRGQPNRVGKDVFAFIMLDNGMLVPYGDFIIASDNWQARCNPENDPPVAGNNAAGLYCTATIFHNNLKVTYED